MSRPSYIHCVAHTHANRKRLSWCGRNIGVEWNFMDIDHAAYNTLSEGRLVACPECVEAIKRALSAVDERPDWIVPT